ncbi:MAG TPA: SH3 domain-containing protein [Candidatus Polarisedimenticolaceae bacterium]|nr:SH3 domain-containing protein [Candidatus Polarisedimenticolaceae bacterium]
MLTTIPHPTLDRLSLGLVILALAGPITYLQVARPSVEDLKKAFGISQSVSVVQPVAPLPVPVPPAVVPTATPVAPPPEATTKPAAKTALTNSFVNLRTGKSVSTPIIARLEAGTTIQLRDDADTTWQGVTYQGKNGYIYRSYIQY